MHFPSGCHCYQLHARPEGEDQRAAVLKGYECVGPVHLPSALKALAQARRSCGWGGRGQADSQWPRDNSSAVVTDKNPKEPVQVFFQLLPANQAYVVLVEMQILS